MGDAQQVVPPAGLVGPMPSRPPGVMVSSTCYDLGQVRDALRQFIEDLGYRPLLSEHPSFPISPDATTINNCRRAVEHDADVLVLVVGGRYGSIDVDSNASVTNLEYLSARHKGIPVYAFIDRDVLAVLPVWARNPAADFSQQVDSVRVFEFIQQIRAVDKVWTNEFSRAQDITDVLRTQFAYQQQVGLRLQRQALGAAQHDWFDTLRGEALRIALDRPDCWEYLLFATALTDGVARHRRLARTHALKLPVGFGEDVPAPLEWVQSRLNDAQRLVGTMTQLANGPLQDAFGQPGEPGDTEGIVFVADTIAELYRDALLWALRLRTAHVGDPFQAVTLAVGDMMDDLIRQVAAFGPAMKAQVEAGLAAARGGTPTRLELTLTITVPEGALDRVNEELAHLAAQYGAATD
jgi:hypothetical protein